MTKERELFPGIAPLMGWFRSILVGIRQGGLVVKKVWV
jgi:hypothetical protein